VSELSNQRVRTPGDVVKMGQEVTVRVLDLDAEGRRVSLSMRQGGVVMKPTAGAVEAAPTTPVKKKKRPVLKGGLDF
jgi:ribosomal protein S1